MLFLKKLSPFDDKLQSKIALPARRKTQKNDKKTVIREIFLKICQNFIEVTINNFETADKKSEKIEILKKYYIGEESLGGAILKTKK